MKYVPNTNEKYALTEDGELISFVARWGKPKVIKGTKNRHGYVTVFLRMENGKYKQFRLHRLMAEVYYPDEFTDECYVLHRNDVRDDNRLENLYIGTKRDNARDVVVNGNHNKANLTLEQVREVRKKLRKTPYWEIAEEYGVSENSIRSILYGITYRQLGDFRLSDKEREIHYKGHGRISEEKEAEVREYAMKYPEATLNQVSEACEVTISSARRIVLGIGKARNTRSYPLRAVARRNGNEEVAKKIIAEWKAGATKTSLSKKYGIDLSMVSRITLGKYKYKSEAAKANSIKRNQSVLVSKGRKLKDKDCDAIREAYLDGQTPNEIAKRRRITVRAVRKILSGKARNEDNLLPVFNGELNEDVEKKWYASGSEHVAAKLSEDAVRFIRETYSNGEYSQLELSDIFDVSAPVIHYANSGVTWQHVQ